MTAEPSRFDKLLKAMLKGDPPSAKRQTASRPSPADGGGGTQSHDHPAQPSKRR